MRSRWVCDDSSAANGNNIWYLVDENGDMVSSGLVKDVYGRYYSLETEHNGYFGMLRYVSGTYGGIELVLEGSHNGAFASILNGQAIRTLRDRYGVKDFKIGNESIVYTSRL